MSYTRFDFKKKSGGKKVLFNFLLMLILAIGLATVLLKVISINSSKIEKSNVNIKQGNKNNSSDNKYVFVQGGVYSKKENVDIEKKLLAAYGIPFVVEENEKWRVFLGVYKEGEVEKNVKALNDAKIDNAKIVYSVKAKDMCDTEIIEVLNAQIQVLNKLSEKDVKSISTDELKKWCLTLNKEGKGGKNIEELKKLKENINKMPKQLTKENLQENYSLIYSILIKIGEKEK